MEVEYATLLIGMQSQAPAPIQHYFPEIINLQSQRYRYPQFIILLFRLWHELTGKLEAFVNEPHAKPFILQLYHSFVVPNAKKLNQQSFVWLSIQAAAQMTNPSEAIVLLSGIAEGFKGKANESHLYVFARMFAAYYQLRAGQLIEAKAAINECAPLVEAFVGVDKSIKAIFYRVNAEFDKVKAAFSDYYRDSLLYLACVELETLGQAEATSQAHDLCVAALLGDSVYNFGELLMHPILGSLKGTQFEYLEQTLGAFNSGNHQQFDALLHAVSSNAILAGHIEFLRQKICLMALVELVFATLKTSRSISFEMISSACRVPLVDVELLLIKALSLGLIRGRIDEVTQTIQVDWVQPRVLDRAQMQSLKASIGIWKSRVSEVASTFVDNTFVKAAAESLAMES
jgi:26S proteasome regulatory subunit N9